ncbi:hypothetical protein [Lactobacillus amylovorus]|uniref:hypothetical protein n=1 Tax=Lactobacillus amylovorus TaxID=1604 RepID=UPI0030C74476
MHPAKEYISDALNAGKNVVTANKDLMATFGSELIALATILMISLLKGSITCKSSILNRHKQWVM